MDVLRTYKIRDGKIPYTIKNDVANSEKKLAIISRLRKIC